MHLDQVRQAVRQAIGKIELELDRDPLLALPVWQTKQRENTKQKQRGSRIAALPSLESKWRYFVCFREQRVGWFHVARSLVRSLACLYRLFAKIHLQWRLDVQKQKEKNSPLMMMMMFAP